jgi:hypothetical protein
MTQFDMNKKEKSVWNRIKYIKKLQRLILISIPS